MKNKLFVCNIKNCANYNLKMKKDEYLIVKLRI